MKSWTAVCPGTFDPATSGHLDVIGRAAEMFERVVVALTSKSQKRTLFSLEERVNFLRTGLSGLDNVEVAVFDGLLVRFAAEEGARFLVKGLRAVSDFDHELQMAQFNRRLEPAVETVFIMTSPQYAFLSSSLVKEIAEYGGSVEGLVAPEVESALRSRLGNGN